MMLLPTYPMAMKCILCVDDDASALELRKLLLGAAGYSVLTAGSGTEALEVLEKGANVDLALLDYMMPGMNGDELAEKLRRTHPEIPLVAVSAVGQLPQAFLNILDSRVQKGTGPRGPAFDGFQRACALRKRSGPERRGPGKRSAKNHSVRGR